MAAEVEEGCIFDEKWYHKITKEHQLMFSVLSVTNILFIPSFGGWKQ